MSSYALLESADEVLLEGGTDKLVLEDHTGAAPAELPLQASSGVAGATFVLTVPTQVVLAASTGLGSAAVAFEGPTEVPLAGSSGVASATLALKATTQIPLAGSAGVATATLVLWYRPLLALASSGSGSGSLSFGSPIIVHPRVFDPGTVVSSFDFQAVEPWCRSSRVPPASYALGSAVVAADGSVTMTGLAVGRHYVLWATVHPLLHAPRQQYVSFHID